MASPTLDASSAAGLAERRYSRAAMALHWLIAAVIATQLSLGWIMNEVLEDHSPPQETVEGIHISLGLTLILLVVLRIAIRSPTGRRACRPACRPRRRLWPTARTWRSTC